MLNRHRRLEWCRPLYRRGASNWASAGRACHPACYDFSSIRRSAGIDLENPLRLDAVELSSGEGYFVGGGTKRVSVAPRGAPMEVCELDTIRIRYCRFRCAQTAQAGMQARISVWKAAPESVSFGEPPIFGTKQDVQ
jgi:hypothetical protein